MSSIDPTTPTSTPNVHESLPGPGASVESDVPTAIQLTNENGGLSVDRGENVDLPPQPPIEAFTQQDVDEARQQGEHGIAFQLWCYIDKLEASIGRMTDEVHRELRRNIVLDLRKIAGSRPLEEAKEQSATWPRYETKQLAALRLAAVRYWEKFDPDDHTTAPKNSDVADWLHEKHGISPSMAEVMASILRSPEVKPGPRK